MLPPGHVAAGYLIALSLLKIAKPDIDPAHARYLLWLGAFFAFAPDLDMFYAFAKVKRFAIQIDKINHRELLSHAPMLWFLAGLILILASHDTFWRLVGLLIWLGSWSHFLLDSIQKGIMWLWPFRRKLFALLESSELKLQEIPQNFFDFKGFFRYWFSFVKYYINDFSATFYLEMVLIITALYVLKSGI